MERRKPPDNKRRAIERMLSRGSEEETARFDERDGDTVRHHPLELEPDHRDEPEVPLDQYQATGIGMFDDPPGEEPPPDGVDSEKQPRGFSSRGALIIAAAILLIGLAASGLIIAREQIVSLFSGSSEPAAEDTAQGQVAALKQEIADLKSERSDAQEAAVELGNLRSANVALQTSLDKEKERVSELEKQIADLQSADTSDPQLTSALQEVERLKGELGKAQSAAADLRDRLDAVNERIVNYSRENSRLNQELDTAKDDARSLPGLRRENEQLRSRVGTLQRDLDSANSQIQVLRSQANRGADSNEQLASVNKEYRRVLDLLQESRNANNQKQERIDQLLTENGKLRQQVEGLRVQVEPQPQEQQVADRGGEDASQPTALDIVRPEYPLSAIKRRVSGVVQLRVLVDERGRVVDARVVSSPDPLKSLDRAALEAVRQWRFDPARRNGEAVRAWQNIPLEFTLGRHDE